jgi:hypothetical protein
VFYRKTVARAARALDEYVLDREWAARINVAHLDVGSHCNCPLGQLFGNFVSDASFAFRRRQSDDVLLAFGDGSRPAPHWSLLTWAWRREITRRQRALANANVDSNVVATGATTDRREWM